MGRETRAVWARRIGRWHRSGLTAAGFAAREGVNPRTLTFWKWKLGHARRASDQPGDPGGDGRVGFVEVLRAATPAASSAPAVELVLPAGYRIRVAAGFDDATLRALLDVLEARR